MLLQIRNGVFYELRQSDLVKLHSNNRPWTAGNKSSTTLHKWTEAFMRCRAASGTRRNDSYCNSQATAARTPCNYAERKRVGRTPTTSIFNINAWWPVVSCSVCSAAVWTRKARLGAHPWIWAKSRRLALFSRRRSCSVLGNVYLAFALSYLRRYVYI